VIWNVWNFKILVNLSQFIHEYPLYQGSVSIPFHERIVEFYPQNGKNVEFSVNEHIFAKFLEWFIKK